MFSPDRKGQGIKRPEILMGKVGPMHASAVSEAGGEPRVPPACGPGLAAPVKCGPSGPRAARPRVLLFSTLGQGSNEEDRIRSLLGAFDPHVFGFDRTRKLGMFRRLLGEILSTRPDLVVMEGTGLAGGTALLLARLLIGCRYVVSSGDAV